MMMEGGLLFVRVTGVFPSPKCIKFNVCQPPPSLTRKSLVQLKNHKHTRRSYYCVSYIHIGLRVEKANRERTKNVYLNSLLKIFHLPSMMWIKTSYVSFTVASRSRTFQSLGYSFIVVFVNQNNVPKQTAQKVTVKTRKRKKIVNEKKGNNVY